jgi:hypothetical protein
VAFNNAGEVAFWGQLNSGGTGIYRGDGTTLTKIAQTDDPDPDAIGFLSGFGERPSINDLGQVAFTALIIQPPLQNLAAVYLGDGTSNLPVAMRGQVAPDGNGHFSNFGVMEASSPPKLVLNNQGQVAFSAELPDASDGATQGIFRGDESTLTQVMRLNAVAPDGNGRFSSVVDVPALNEAGQVAFEARLTNTSGGTTDDRGIFLFDDTLGLIQVAREGDEFLGSVITRAGLYDGRGLQDEFFGLSQTGPTRLAYVFALADGRRGIAVWSLVPEPGSIVLVGLAVIGLGACGRRRRGHSCRR